MTSHRCSTALWYDCKVMKQFLSPWTWRGPRQALCLEGASPQKQQHAYCLLCCVLFCFVALLTKFFGGSIIYWVKEPMGEGRGTKWTRSAGPCAGERVVDVGKRRGAQERRLCPASHRGTGRSKSPWSGCLGRPVSPITKLPLSCLLCRCVAWKLLRTAWKSFIRKLICAEGDHSMRGTGPSQSFLGQKRPVPPRIPTTLTQWIWWPHRQSGWAWRARSPSPAGLQGHLRGATTRPRAPGQTVVQAPGLSWSIALKQTHGKWGSTYGLGPGPTSQWVWFCAQLRTSLVSNCTTKAASRETPPALYFQDPCPLGKSSLRAFLTPRCFSNLW